MAVLGGIDSNQTAEIVFFDLETTVPNRSGQQRFWVLEFGAMVVCPRKLVETESFSSLIRPGDLSAVPLKSSRPQGITRQAVEKAPSFKEVADRVHNILDGRIWAGHNIQRFDCVRIKEAFADINRPPPQPAGIIDSLGVLTQKFGRRAGNMKMATLADYFGLGQQKHRSLDDVRMNLEVLKNCATVLFLESSLPSLSNSKWQPSSCCTMTTRSQSNILRSSIRVREESGCSRRSPPTASYHRASPYSRTSFRKVTEGVKSVWTKAQGRQPVISILLNHSQSILR
ncbi:hypothetical protein V2J09_008925 [Rumex salicifolius]